MPVMVPSTHSPANSLNLVLIYFRVVNDTQSQSIQTVAKDKIIYLNIIANLFSIFDIHWNYYNIIINILEGNIYKNNICNYKWANILSSSRKRWRKSVTKT